MTEQVLSTFFRQVQLHVSDVFAIGIEVGVSTDYTVTFMGGVVLTVADNRVGSPDGTDTIIGIETLHFNSDGVDTPTTAYGLGVSYANTLSVNNYAGTTSNDIHFASGGNDIITTGGGQDAVIFGTGFELEGALIFSNDLVLNYWD